MNNPANGSFSKDVAKLLTGTLGARVIALAAVPIVTRLYTPDDFTLLALYIGIVNTAAVAACLRFDVAIPIAKTSEDAANLMALALSLALGVGGVFLIITLLASTPIAGLLGHPEFAQYMWLVPLGVVMMAFYSAMQYWATRHRRFGIVARTRVTQSAAGVSAMIGFGWAGITPFGLLLGNIINQSMGSFSLIYSTITRDREILATISPRQMLITLRAYKRYPLLSTPEAFINIAGAQVPIILIAALGDAEAGFLLLAMQMAALPMSLLGSSISQVYVSRAPTELEEGQLADFTYAILKKLVYIGVVPIIIAGFVSVFVFPTLFGAQWTRSGEIVAIMVPWIILQFIAVPISMVMLVTGNQAKMLVLSSFGTIIRIGSIPAAALFLAVNATYLFIAASTIFYIVSILVYARAAGITKDWKNLGLAAMVVALLLGYTFAILTLIQG